LNLDKTNLEEKVMRMKQSVQEIKNKLDTEIHNKFENKDNLIKTLRAKLETSEQ
jgi:hypothetical protein